MSGGTIHIYLLNLSGDLPDASLSPPPWMQRDCHARYSRMQSKKRRNEFLGGRFLIHYGLNHFPDIDASRWEIRAEENGPIRLVSTTQEPAPSLLLSLSHSQNLVACALARADSLGLDIEVCRPLRHSIDELAKTVMHEDEKEYLARLSPQAALPAFFRLWTLKEAFGKALGTGIRFPMRECSFLDGKLSASPKTLGIKPEEWQFFQQNIGEDALLSLACKSRQGDKYTLQMHQIGEKMLVESFQSKN